MNTCFNMLSKPLLLSAMVLMFVSNTHAQYLKELKHNRNDTGRVELLQKYSHYYLSKEGELANDLDSALRLNDLALKLSVNLKYNKGITKGILLKSQIYREKGEWKKALEILNEAFTTSERFHLKEQTAAIYIEYGQYYRNEGNDLEQKISYYKKALPLFRETGNKKEEGTTLQLLGDFYQLKGNADTAILYLEQSLVAYHGANYKDLQGVYNLIGMVYMQKGNYPLALKYGLMAVKTGELLNDSSIQMGTTYNRVALIYYNLFNDKEAMEYWNKGLAVAVRHKDTASYQVITSNIVAGLRRAGKYNEALVVLTNMIKKYPPSMLETRLRVPYLFFNLYMDMKEYNKALPYYNQIVRFHEQVGNNAVFQIYLSRSIIRYLIYTKQYEQTYKYLKEIDETCKLIGNNQNRSENQLDWFRVDSAQGRYFSAIQHHLLYKSLSDSIFNIEKSKLFSSLQLQFETEKKDKDILLLTQRSQLQYNSLLREKSIRNIIIGGIVILSLFSGLIYNSYRSKRRSNMNLELKQKEINQQNELLKKLLGEKEWLLKEIHHRVKNNLQIVISLLNTQSAYLDNEDGLAAIRNSQYRMYAMSLIHQKLYQSDDLASIDMSWYIRELVNYMQECFHTDTSIQFHLNTEKVDLDIAQAVPLGLILNEAISNAIKYAFPGKRKGDVEISLQKLAGNTCELIIADNGIGLPEHFEPGNTDSLGMSLMLGLSEQLDGTFEVENDNGLKIKITFDKHQQLLQYER
ncbi:Two-component sensor histidine kinase, contains HisKA and HATPase domains [Chitinophaga sp. CF118]|uniref:tetratricopeptide repeat-containing sensor histidine kinase n=1 Tax=Chitinophaga sp. CF118 TaxID=1884367 RepID=UPI0008E66743|nr:histidine kinase dimerization/phosphoacceptor domain -containing protein [Chitinophaga sp. CF118]SFD75088.1 Two-component sensor histidine kinase, contains HisKA and HATPase domains [Chitinophaga sp. CF118]